MVNLRKDIFYFLCADTYGKSKIGWESTHGRGLPDKPAPVPKGKSPEAKSPKHYPNFMGVLFNQFWGALSRVDLCWVVLSVHNGGDIKATDK